MRTITNDIINEIRNKSDIVSIVSNYVPLTKRGKNYFGVCPFHDDHSPSMSVSPEKQIYTCFSCGATGNVFTFISEYEHISFIEAVRLLGNKLGFNLTSTDNKVDTRSNDYKIYDLAIKFYQNNLSSTLGKNAMEYLDKRKLNRDIIKKFGIGLSLNKSNLTEILLQKGVSLDKLIELGLSNNLGNDLFLNRIMFPLYDLSGNVVGFSGRIYNMKDNSKYINTKESPIFKKGNLLYNYHRAREYLKKNDYVIIMEGFMDVIRASTVGIDNCVATMGTAFTKEQAAIVKKMTDNVILCFDGDKAGEDATNAAIKVLENLNINIKIIRLEDNLDPDEYIQEKGKESFVAKIDKAINVIEYKLSLLKKEKNFTNLEDISTYIDESIKELVKVKDDVLIELTLKKFSQEYNISYETLKNKYETYNKKTVEVKKEMIIPKKEKKRMTVYEKAERKLLYYMLKSEEVLSIVEANISFFPTSEIRHLSNEIICFYHKYGKIDVADFISFIEVHEELLKVLYQIINMDMKDGYTKEEIDDYIHVIKEYFKKSKIDKLQNMLKSEVDPIKQASILSEIMAVKGVK